MQRTLKFVGVAFATVLVAGVAGAAGCTADTSVTDLNEAGPPMVRQVRFGERFVETNMTTGDMTTRSRRVFGFGTHPDAGDAEVHPVTSADATDNTFRIIMDELLVGNNLEEVVCRGLVDDDNLGRVPVGATPDDVAKCSLPNDALVDGCPNGPHAICICQNQAGCMRGTETIPINKPVGILDEDLDGAADKTVFINGAVTLRCKDTIDVPLDLDASYWNPSGNQTAPAMGGFDALGPAIVLAPKLLPTNVTCRLAFSTDVVDKQGITVCEPPAGDVTQDCTPGDTSAFTFKVEPLTFTPSRPFVNGQMGVARQTSLAIELNVPLDAATITNITISPAAPIMVRLSNMGSVLVIEPVAATGFAPTTTYTITIPTTVTDTFGQPASGVVIFTFTTAAT